MAPVFGRAPSPIRPSGALAAMIACNVHERIATLTLHRSGARNAISIAGWHALAEAAAQIGASDAVAVILQSGHAGIFSAGADLAEFRELIDDPALRMRFRMAMAEGIEAIAALPMPVIGAVDGGCFGAAVALTLACDIVIAGDDAVFATTPAKLGIGYPARDVARLKARVGGGQAAAMLFTGDRIDADTALRIGLVHRRAEQAGPAAMAMAGMISTNDAAAVRLLKSVLCDPLGAAHDQSFEDAFGSSAFAARLDAFLGGKR